LKTLDEIRAGFNRGASGARSRRRLDRAAGGTAVEKAAGRPDGRSPCPSRRAAWTHREQTDVKSFEPSRAVADGFRNFLRGRYSVPAEALLIDKAQLLR
jgi:catalase-peroxidase